VRGMGGTAGGLHSRGAGRAGVHGLSIAPTLPVLPELCCPSSAFPSRLSTCACACFPQASRPSTLIRRMRSLTTSWTAPSHGRMTQRTWTQTARTSSTGCCTPTPSCDWDTGGQVQRRGWSPAYDVPHRRRATNLCLCAPVCLCVFVCDRERPCLHVLDRVEG